MTQKLMFALGLTLLASNIVYAGPGADNPPLTGNDATVYYNNDHFQWANYDNDVHILLAYGGALTIGLVLEHNFKVNRYLAAFIGSAVAGSFGIAKEVLHDEWTSRTDIKCWVGGAALAGVTMTVLQF